MFNHALPCGIPIRDRKKREKLKNLFMIEDNMIHKKHGHADHVLTFFIEEKEYKSKKQYINGSEIKKQGGFPHHWEVTLAIAKPWEDEVIKDDTEVDLARPGKEHFHVRQTGHGVLVNISINEKKYEVKRGKYSVAQLKSVGSVSQADELVELIDGQLVPLKEDAPVLVKGGEEFFSHKPDGTSS
jgi:hypothetical protein